MPQPKDYNTEEAAEYLRMSKQTLRKLVQKGEIARFNAGGGWRYAESDLDDYRDSKHRYGKREAARIRAENAPKPVGIRPYRKNQKLSVDEQIKRACYPERYA